MASNQSFNTQSLDSWTAGGNLPYTGQMAGRTIYDGKIWIGALTVFVSTEDGNTYDTIGNMPLFPEELGGSRLEHFDGKFWLVAGSNFNQGTHLDTVWNSTDGTLWSAVSTLPGVRYGGALYEFNDKLWYAGGETPGPVSRSEVYSSADGITWNLEGNLPGPRAHVRGVIFRNKMWLMGGDVNGAAPEDDVWSSEDGITWTAIGTLPAGRNNGDVVVY